jgi:hypothetical protein
LPRYAIIENDEVVNVIVADSAFLKETKIQATECGDEVYPGWKYVGKEFIAPEPNYAPEVIDETLPE